MKKGVFTGFKDFMYVCMYLEGVCALSSRRKGRGRGRERISDYSLNVELDVGFDPMTVRSQPEPKLRARHLTC